MGPGRWELTLVIRHQYQKHGDSNIEGAHLVVDLGEQASVGDAAPEGVFGICDGG